MPHSVSLPWSLSQKVDQLNVCFTTDGYRLEFFFSPAKRPGSSECEALMLHDTIATEECEIFQRLTFLIHLLITYVTLVCIVIY